MADNMEKRLTFKNHLIGIGLVFLLGSMLGFAYTTFYYESRANYNVSLRSDIKAKSRIYAEEEIRAYAKKKEMGEEIPWEDISLEELASRKEKEILNQYSDSLNNYWSKHLFLGMFTWWPWVVLTPLILFICHRFRFSAGSLRASISIHILSGLVVGAAKSLIEYYLMKEFLGRNSVMLGVGNVTIACSTYWTYVAAYNGIVYYRGYREREIITSRLEKQLAQSQLKVLKMQLHPHFLFNTLHAISTLMNRDVETADRMICRLSDLLRLSLMNIELQEVPLQQELDFLKCYLDIEQMRFGDRLVVERRIDTEVMDAYVPNLILQPIVENAINHGISRIASTGRIVLAARREEDLLVLDVYDNGPGLTDDSAFGALRVGLANTRARLAQLYGGRGGITFITPEQGGLMVRLNIPFHESAKTGTQILKSRRV
ncbi:MAG: histidine kinase [Planctomycetota bacterium]